MRNLINVLKLYNNDDTPHEKLSILHNLYTKAP